MRAKGGLQAQEPESKEKGTALDSFLKYCHDCEATHEKSVVGGVDAWDWQLVWCEATSPCGAALKKQATV